MLYVIGCPTTRCHTRECAVDGRSHEGLLPNYDDFMSFSTSACTVGMGEEMHSRNSHEHGVFKVSRNIYDSGCFIMNI